MAFYLVNNGTQNWQGLSTDRKPGVVPDAIGQPAEKIDQGDSFHEIDTGFKFIWHGSRWVQMKHPGDAAIEALTAEVKTLAEVIKEQQLQETTI